VRWKGQGEIRSDYTVYYSGGERAERGVAIVVHKSVVRSVINPLTLNDPFRGRTAPLTSRRCILYIYSTSIRTQYFKHAAHSPFFFSLQNAVHFIMLPFLVSVLFTF
jgi:hypothetical protein